MIAASAAASAVLFTPFLKRFTLFRRHGFPFGSHFRALCLTLFWRHSFPLGPSLFVSGSPLFPFRLFLFL
jgi:hypothetical protein